METLIESTIFWFASSLWRNPHAKTLAPSYDMVQAMLHLLHMDEQRSADDCNKDHDTSLHGSHALYFDVGVCKNEAMEIRIPGRQIVSLLAWLPAIGPSVHITSLHTVAIRCSLRTKGVVERTYHACFGCTFRGCLGPNFPCPLLPAFFFHRCLSVCPQPPKTTLPNTKQQVLCRE